MKKAYLLVVFLLFCNRNTFAQSSISLSGPNTFCANGTATFTVTGGSAASYTWSVSSNLQIISGQGTSSVQVSGNGPSATGTGTVTVQLGDVSCGISLSHQTVLTGPPNVSFTIQPFINGDFCINSRFTMSVEPQNLTGVDYYEWGYIDMNGPGPATVVNPAGGVYQPDFVFDHAGTYEIYARPGNACGLGSIVTYIAVVSDNCDGGGGRLGGFAAFPNPAGNTLTITSTDKSSTNNVNSTGAKKPDTPFSYKIYDESGKLVKSGKSNGADANVDTHDLPSKIYILNIFTGDKVIKKSVIIQHK